MRYSGLPDDPHNKINTDLSPVRIGNCKNDIPLDHVGMLASLKRPIESKITQPPDKFSPGKGDNLMR